MNQTDMKSDPPPSPSLRDAVEQAMLALVQNSCESGKSPTSPCCVARKALEALRGAEYAPDKRWLQEIVMGASLRSP